jgi:hypothetical protein
MRRTIIIVLALAACSPPAVRRIGLHEYMITNAGNQLFPKAIAVCAKLGRQVRGVGVPPSEVGIDWGKQYKFECILDYEVVPIGKESYRVLGTGAGTLGADTCQGCSVVQPFRGPNWGEVDRKVGLSAREYCAKMNKVMVVTGGSFDSGMGEELIFRCDPPEQAGTHR